VQELLTVGKEYPFPDQSGEGYSFVSAFAKIPILFTRQPLSTDMKLQCQLKMKAVIVVYCWKILKDITRIYRNIKYISLIYTVKNQFAKRGNYACW